MYTPEYTGATGHTAQVPNTYALSAAVRARPRGAAMGDLCRARPAQSDRRVGETRRRAAARALPPSQVRPRPRGRAARGRAVRPGKRAVRPGKRAVHPGCGLCARGLGCAAGPTGSTAHRVTGGILYREKSVRFFSYKLSNQLVRFFPCYSRIELVRFFRINYRIGLSAFSVLNLGSFSAFFALFFRKNSRKLKKYDYPFRDVEGARYLNLGCHIARQHAQARAAVARAIGKRRAPAPAKDK